MSFHVSSRPHRLRDDRGDAPGVAHPSGPLHPHVGDHMTALTILILGMVPFVIVAATGGLGKVAAGVWLFAITISNIHDLRR